MTSKKLGIALFSLLVLALFAFTPATAGDYVKNITAGDTVLVGESGLCIAGAVAGSPYIAY
ncbi:MAG: hypothetical protein PHO78_07445, partial [Methanomicrobium sp.]|nr:hypothetical protein [Methanomicrobium sp.]